MAPDTNSKRSIWSRLRMRLFHLYFLFVRPMTLGVRILVHDRDENRVILVKHTYVDGWHLPGGGVEAGETVLAALDRELREETGVAATSPPRIYALYFNRQASRRDHVALYIVEEFSKVVEFAPTVEISAAEFFVLDQLPDEISPSTARRIDEVIGGIDVSAYW